MVRVVLGCVCGSDLWYYRGESPHAAGSIGHEFIGVVEQAGAGVTAIRPGNLVVAPFIYSDMSCPRCLTGSTISCPAGGGFGNGEIDGGQGEAAARGDIDAAYHAKYDRYGPRIVGSVTGPDAYPVTVRLVPQSERG